MGVRETTLTCRLGHAEETPDTRAGRPEVRTVTGGRRPVEVEAGTAIGLRQAGGGPAGHAPRQPPLLGERQWGLPRTSGPDGRAARRGHRSVPCPADRSRARAPGRAAAPLHRLPADGCGAGPVRSRPGPGPTPPGAAEGGERTRRRLRPTPAAARPRQPAAAPDARGAADRAGGPAPHADGALRLLAPLRDDGPALLVATATLLQSDRPHLVLSLGRRTAVRPLGQVLRLLRCLALLDCHRPHDAVDDLRALAAEAHGNLRDAARALLVRAHTEGGEVEQAARAAVDLLQADPLDAAAALALGRLHDVLDAGGAVVPAAPDGTDRAPRRTVASLEAELRAAEEDLLESVDLVTACVDEHGRRVGRRVVQAARLRTRLAELIAEHTQDAENRQTARQAHDEAGRQEEQQTAREAAGPEPEEDRQAASDATLPEDEEREAKKLDRLLSRRWHPDTAGPDDDLTQRADVFRRVRDLWERRDLQGLRDLWAAGDDARAPGAGPGAGPVPDHVRAAELRTALAQVLDEHERLLASPAEAFRQGVLRSAAEGADLFEELAAELDEEIAALLEALRQAEGARRS